MWLNIEKHDINKFKDKRLLALLKNNYTYLIECDAYDEWYADSYGDPLLNMDEITHFCIIDTIPFEENIYAQNKREY